jgi:hypothetical protein
MRCDCCAGSHRLHRRGSPDSVSRAGNSPVTHLIAVFHVALASYSPLSSHHTPHTHNTQHIHNTHNTPPLASWWCRFEPLATVLRPFARNGEIYMCLLSLLLDRPAAGLPSVQQPQFDHVSLFSVFSVCIRTRTAHAHTPPHTRVLRTSRTESTWYPDNAEDSCVGGVSRAVAQTVRGVPGGPARDPRAAQGTGRRQRRRFAPGAGGPRISPPPLRLRQGATGNTPPHTHTRTHDTLYSPLTFLLCGAGSRLWEQRGAGAGHKPPVPAGPPQPRAPGRHPPGQGRGGTHANPEQTVFHQISHIPSHSTSW